RVLFRSVTGTGADLEAPDRDAADSARCQEAGQQSDAMDSQGSARFPAADQAEPEQDGAEAARFRAAVRQSDALVPPDLARCRRADRADKWAGSGMAAVTDTGARPHPPRGACRDLMASDTPSIDV